MFDPFRKVDIIPGEPGENFLLVCHPALSQIFHLELRTTVHADSCDTEVARFDEDVVILVQAVDHEERSSGLAGEAVEADAMRHDGLEAVITLMHGLAHFGTCCCEFVLFFLCSGHGISVWWVETRD
ncbi:hypothetical protein HQ487_01190 [Candidatus Uhrbacteria bacterium]|nr:hypothetical protein [Candidatus Uhrbacteria bacterium]